MSWGVGTSGLGVGRMAAVRHNASAVGQLAMRSRPRSHLARNIPSMLSAARPVAPGNASRLRVRSAAVPKHPRQAFSTSSRRCAGAETAPAPGGSSNNESAGQKLKDLIKKYGRHALGVYLALSLVDFSLCFALVHLVGAERIAPVTDWVKEQYHEVRYGAEEATRMRAVDEQERAEDAAEERRAARQGKNSGGFGSAVFWTEFALAYSIHKIGLLPVRAGLTVAWTPKLVAWLTRRGWIGKVRIGREP